MKFGQFNLMTLPGPESSQAEVIDTTLDLVRQAEQLDFDIAWFAEHHFSNYSMCVAPLMMAARAAGVTERIRLGPAILVLPLYHPVRVVEETVFFDQVAGGRSVIGLGSGYQAYEFDGFGLDIADKLEQTHEIWDLLEQAIDSGELGYQGKHVKIPPRPMCVSLAQPRLPEVFVAGTNPSLVERVARGGHTSFISAGFQGLEKMKDLRAQVDQGHRNVGLDPDSARVAIHRYIFITEDKAEALKAAECVRFIARTIANMVQGEPVMNGPFIDPRPFDGEPPLEQILANVNIGDAETVAEKMAAEIRACRPHHYSCFFAFGPLEGRLALRSLERFGSQVLPLLEREFGDLATLNEPGAAAAAQ